MAVGSAQEKGANDWAWHAWLTSDQGSQTNRDVTFITMRETFLFMIPQKP